MSFSGGSLEYDVGDHHDVSFRCDHPECDARSVTCPDESSAITMAQGRGWYVDQRVAFCPLHRAEHDHAGPDWIVGLDLTPEQDKPSPAPGPPVIQSVEVASPFLLILVSVFAVATFVLLLLLIREYSKRDIAEYSLRSFNQEAFERRSGIQELSCTSLFDTPRHCSGRMRTEGKPDTAVRYVCDAEDCRFE